MRLYSNEGIAINLCAMRPGSTATLPYKQDIIEEWRHSDRILKSSPDPLTRLADALVPSSHAEQGVRLQKGHLL